MAVPVLQNFLKVLVDPKDPDADIVAVHGLNTTNTKLHAEAAWTSDNGNLWLRDFLPPSLPTARVLLFSYNANIAFRTSTAGVREQAKNLLSLIALNRGNNKDRPLVFIAHSLGGIIVKRALVEAQLDDTYKAIREATYGIAFFGTPHRGGKHTKLGELAAATVRGLLGNPSNNFLEALQKDSSFAESLQDDFRHQLENYQILSFYETRPTGRFGVVVEKDSATLGLPGLREKQILMETDHIGLCKFPNAYSSDYKQVASEIVELVHSAVKRAGARASDASLYTATTEEADQRCLHALRSTDPQDDKHRIEATKDNLLQESCSWIFQDQAFLDWWDHDDSPLLFIHGDAGKGKTMMMMALINEVSRRLKHGLNAGIVAYFFCQNTDQRLNTTAAVLKGLIFMLIRQKRTLICHLRKRYDDSGDNVFQGPNAVYALRDLLFQMLNDPSLSNVYLLVDALDECDEDIHLLLERIIQNRSDYRHVKWLMTSRNEPTIKEQLKSSFILQTSLELNSLHLSDAVNAYIERKVTDLTERKSYTEDLKAFVKDYLCQKADGTFLWVALVCKALKNVATWKTKSVLLKFPAGLDPLYGRMMEELNNQGDEEDVDLCKQILRSVSLTLRPLHVAELPALASLPEDIHTDEMAVEGLVSRCGSFLTTRQEIVYFIHQSAKEYLSKQIFPAGQATEHEKIARVCLKLLSNKLDKSDLCNLRLPGILIDEIDRKLVNQSLPQYTHYACLFWLDHHLQAYNDDLFRDEGLVHLFCQRHFLFWLEAISLMRKSSQGLLIIRKLEARLDATDCPALRALVHDMKRFVLKFAPIIAKAPLQVYASALVFSPTQSLVKKGFLNCLPRWLLRFPVVEDGWSPCLQTLEGHKQVVGTVRFSPDGLLLVSGSWDHTVRLWDPVTGEGRGILEGHTKAVRSVEFSPRFSSGGRLLASASEDRTVRIWDCETWKARSILEGHTQTVWALAFSIDGYLLASGSRDCTVRLWHCSTGKALITLEGHTEAVSNVLFSPDGKLLASGSKDCKIRLWDCKTWELHSTLTGHIVNFSPDGQLLASGSVDHTLRLWDAVTGAAYKTLEGHTDLVYSVEFSPNGRLLASSSADSTIRLWDPITGNLRSILEGHIKPAGTIIFSPHGQLLASTGSGDDSIRLWDVAKGEPICTLTGHTSTVCSIAFSPDGKLLASGSFDSDVRLWDPKVVEARNAPEGHHDKISTLTFSPDGRFLASGSTDQTVQMLDVSRMKNYRVFKGHTNMINDIAFSFDGRLLASCSLDRTVRLWDSVTGDARGTLIGHTTSVYTVVFSPDSRLLASGSRDNTLRLWDSGTGKARSILRGHIAAVICAAFSCDGQLLASGSHDATIRIWDSNTGQERCILKGHTTTVVAVAFSPKGQILASASRDNTVRLWEINTGIQVKQCDAYGISQVSFSSESSVLKTDCGLIPLSNLPFKLQNPTLSSTHWRLQGKWFTCNNDKVLWLPPDFRPQLEERTIARKGNLFALGLFTGQIKLLEFHPSPDFLWWVKIV